MSVLKSKRGESTMQFLETARKLRIFKRWFDEGKMSMADIQTSYVSWKGHLKHCNAYNVMIRTDVMFNNPFKEDTTTQ